MNAGYAHAKLGTPSQRPFGGFVQRMPGTRCVLTPTSGVLVIGSWIYLPSTCRGLDSAAFINSRVLLQGWEGDERFSVFFCVLFLNRTSLQIGRRVYHFVPTPPLYNTLLCALRGTLSSLSRWPPPPALVYSSSSHASDLIQPIFQTGQSCLRVKATCAANDHFSLEKRNSVLVKTPHERLTGTLPKMGPNNKFVAHLFH